MWFFFSPLLNRSKLGRRIKISFYCQLLTPFKARGSHSVWMPTA